ncbi:PREDICTED: coiled-coil domain-containing protein 63-like [Dinoponera quadriceps]|uniref:Coiled-coil domain-containing protein 63-like n=1 Tax=Dinoponera quadriceps TaxID=609295 RepID=A0A6P3XEA1_DINQU|nr:PREDICTED: coiled-coil domain-containing protein 63-like [Dinoponera quadriceps]
MAYRQQPVQDELETMAETELSRLKRQYRIMENDRATCVEDARLQLRNQQNRIDRLEYEKAELVLAIKTAKSKSFARKDTEMDEKLRCLLEKRAKYIDMIENEKRQIAELDEQIGKLSKEVGSLKSKVRSDTQLRDLAVRHSKMVFMLENRVEVATKRFNLVVAENAKLRAEIETLLKERAQFTIMWNKLIGQLNTGKQIINDLIEQATITFNQRDEELNKIQALRERGIRDLNSHTSEMCELKRTLDNEMKLQEFLGVKGQYREMADLNAKKEADRQAKREEKQNKIEAFTHILQTIKQFTGEQEIDKLTAHFVKQEEENFALFSYVNELNDELESLQLRMEQLTAAIDEARVQNVHHDQEQAETLEKITKQLEEQTALADTAEEDLTKCNDVMEKLLQGIDALFKSIGCDNSPILELLGDNTHVTMSNVMLYLGIIEKQITEMFHKIYWVDKATKPPQLRLDESRKPRLKVPALTRIVPTQPCALCVEEEQMQFVSEGLEAPLTRAEAMQKLRQRLEDDYAELLHNVSGCHLPAARKIMQRRYQ